jgi:streptogramin lyase
VSLTQSVVLGTTTTVTFGRIASGASASIVFPATLSGEGTAAVSFQAKPPAGVPAAQFTQLAYIVVKPGSALSFSATPAITGAFPIGVLSGYAYVALYDPTNPRLGWTIVGGPAQATGKSVTLPSMLHEPAISFASGKSYLFALVERDTVLATPSPAPYSITEYGIPGAIASTYVDHIAAGPDGDLWFTETDGTNAASIDKMTTKGKLTRFPLVQPPYDDPKGIAAGPDGNEWFTETNLSKIAKITPAGKLTEYPLPTTGTAPWGITAGPDGNMWFTEPDYGPGAIGKITTNGVVTEYLITIPPGATLPFAPSPLYIAAGPDGNLWFTESSSSDRVAIGKITTSGVMSFYKLRQKYAAPYGITAGPGGKMWFVEESFGTIASITTSGKVTEYYAGGVGSILNEIALGSDGNLWATDETSLIVKLTPQGHLSQYPTPTQPSDPSSLAIGSDGNVWFTEAGRAQIGKLVVPKRAQK